MSTPLRRIIDDEPVWEHVAAVLVADGLGPDDAAVAGLLSGFEIGRSRRS